MRRAEGFKPGRDERFAAPKDALSSPLRDPIKQERVRRAILRTVLGLYDQLGLSQLDRQQNMERLIQMDARRLAQAYSQLKPLVHPSDIPDL